MAEFRRKHFQANRARKIELVGVSCRTEISLIRLECVTELMSVGSKAEAPRPGITGLESGVKMSPEMRTACKHNLSS